MLFILLSHGYLASNLSMFIILQLEGYHTMDVVTLSSKGRIVIPAKVRKKFSLKTGDSLVIFEEKGAICLQPRVNLSKLWGIDNLKNTRAVLNEMRKEWDDDVAHFTHRSGCKSSLN